MRYTVSHEMNPGGELTSETDVQITVGALTAWFQEKHTIPKTSLTTKLLIWNINCAQYYVDLLLLYYTV